MISDELVSLETAKLAKDKGFNWLCSSVKIETIEGSEREVFDEEECRYTTVKDVIKTRIPTQARLGKWLREEKGICVSVVAYTTFATKNKLCFGWIIKHNSDGFSIKTIDSDDVFSTYELALEDALKYALEKLV